MMKSNLLLYVGTYDRQPLSGTASNGIYVYTLNASTGQAVFQSVVRDIQNPSFLAIDSAQQTLYAVDENSEIEASTVNAYAIDFNTGDLQFINQQLTHGTSPCYVAVDQTDQIVAVANYGSGTISLLPVGENGRLFPASDVHQHEGSSVNPNRQAEPHAHCVVIDPTNRFLFAVDLGCDKVMSYRLDPKGPRLVPHEASNVELPPGSGPRHLRFHNNGRFAYVINELHSTITALNYDADHGSFSTIHTTSTLPADFKGESYGAEICVAPSGRFLYASNRGHDSLAIFAISEETGRLTHVAHQSTHGKTPRHFTIEPSGTFLLVANQDSDTIVIFRIDTDTGHLDLFATVPDVPTPVCLKMIDFSKVA